MLSSSQVDGLLSKLCVRLGFCLSPAESERLKEAPPNSVDTFVDAVFIAEGLEPMSADRQLYRAVRSLVSEAFQTAVTR